jgi:hypothetical protein
MKYIYITFTAFSLALISMTVHAADDEWTLRNRIEEMQVVDGTDYLRMRVTDTTVNPANCLNSVYVDYQLDTNARSETEQRLILDMFNMALIMSKPVEFYIDGDECSSAGTSSTIRIAKGFKVHRN